MARQVSKRVVEQSRAMSPPAAPPPAAAPAAYVGDGPVDIDISLDDLGPPKAPALPRPPVGVPVELPPLEDARRKPRKSIWTGHLRFGLEGQPYSYAAVRMAMMGGFLFPPLFLVAIVSAVIGVARGERSATKVFAWVTIGSVVYCAILVGLIMVIVDMMKMMGGVHY
jgi:hypothetical protein